MIGEIVYLVLCILEEQSLCDLRALCVHKQLPDFETIKFLCWFNWTRMTAERVRVKAKGLSRFGLKRLCVP